MKSSFITICAIVLFFSCKNDKDTTYPITDPNESTTKSMEGAWELVGFYNYIDNKVVDSFKTREG
jgi:hypothetical protein